MNGSIVFPHIIKTGGSTVSAHLLKHMLDRYHHVAYDIPGRPAIGDADFVQGHDVQGKTKEPARFFTILRHPADWMLSVYHHNIARGGADMDFWTWYRTNACRVNNVNDTEGWPDPILRWICRHFLRSEEVDLIAVTRMLESYWFVTTTEHLDDDLPMIFAMLGVPTKCSRERVAGVFDRWDNTEIPKRYCLSLAERERIAQEHRSDMELYKLALSLRKTRSSSDASRGV